MGPESYRPEAGMINTPSEPEAPKSRLDELKAVKQERLQQEREGRVKGVVGAFTKVSNFFKRLGTGFKDDFSRVAQEAKSGAENVGEVVGHGYVLIADPRGRQIAKEAVGDAYNSVKEGADGLAKQAGDAIRDKRLDRLNNAQEALGEKMIRLGSEISSANQDVFNFLTTMATEEASHLAGLKALKEEFATLLDTPGVDPAKLNRVIEAQSEAVMVMAHGRAANQMKLDALQGKLSQLSARMDGFEERAAELREKLASLRGAERGAASAGQAAEAV